MALTIRALAALVAFWPALATAGWVEDRTNLSHDSTGPIEFSHFRHLEKLGKDCPTCHNSIFDIRRPKTTAISMAQMAEGKSCGACHDGGRAFSIKGSCTRCHPVGEALYRLPKAGDVVFSHDVHTASHGCAECHPRLFKPAKGNPTRTMDEMGKGLGCGACHNGTLAFSTAGQCGSCHRQP